MPIFVAALVGGLAQAASHLVGRVLLALGVGFVAFTGLSAGVEAVQTQVLAGLSGLPSLAVQLIGVLQVGTCINILCSAMLARLTIRGLSSGVVKKMVQT
jgi:hypothetical protein